MASLIDKNIFLCNIEETLNNRKAEIVNSFIRFKGIRVSNGPIEGRNSMIKKILKIANGYSNFRRFRNRVMYCLNRYATHSFKTEDQVKDITKGRSET